MELHELLKHLINVFEKFDIEYFVAGSIASIFYGEPRFTNDIDVVADINENHISKLLKSFPEEEFYLSEEAIRDAIKHRYQFNIIHPSSGLKIDIIVSGKNDFMDSQFARKKRITPVEGTQANFSSPEDIIIMKMVYYKEGNSEKHLRDIIGILKISENVIDKEYIENWVNKLGLSDIWKVILEKL